VEPALDESLSHLGTDYLDLYLIHWSALKLIIFIAALTQNFRPVAFINGGKQNEVDWELTENPYPTWKKLEEMVDKGKVRNIGISKCVSLPNYSFHFIELRYKQCSFNIHRIQNLTANPLKIKPYVNQVELNYWNPQPELLKVRKLSEPFLMHILINMKIVVQRKRYFTGSLFPTWQC
jgi:diketogulonate reductase-like aldo/keto reductase